jgi:hypothetical protein
MPVDQRPVGQMPVGHMAFDQKEWSRFNRHLTLAAPGHFVNASFCLWGRLARGAKIYGEIS